MTFAIFVRSELVVNPGWKGIEDMLIIAIACWGVSFAMFGRMLRTRGSDVMLRAVLALFSLVVMLYPDDTVALGAAVVVMLATFYGTYRHGLIARPKSTLEQVPVS
jgi:surface polysaccharide O-acyltransferase-like enzyme